jgi:hypothetical protein
MPRSNGRRLTALCAAWLLLISASGCAKAPPIVSGDLSCEKFRHISASEDQLRVFDQHWDVMESYADQIVSHNITYDAHCLEQPAGK